MARARVSTTVDGDLLNDARALREGLNDAALLDEALSALLARHRAAWTDASYAAYDEHPIDEPDEWGDLGSFRDAAGTS
jgi:post-segregation antitoxin (ccd killing protein)